MYQIIGESISVLGIYEPTNSKFKPLRFKWHGRTLTIEKITLVNDAKDGGVRQRFFSVMVGGNLYRLIFNRESEIWTLDQIWVEG